MTSNLYQGIERQINLRVIEKGMRPEPETANCQNDLIQRSQSLGQTNVLLIELEKEYKIEFIKKKSAAFIKECVFSPKALWYKLTILFAAISALAILVIPESAVPLVYLRSGLGVIFVMFLPGFAFIKMLFPTKVPFKNASESMDTLQRVVLSLGMSLILTSIVGLILNYTPWGLRLTSITLSQLTLTVLLATIAVFRELKQDNSKQNDEVAFNQ